MENVTRNNEQMRSLEEHLDVEAVAQMVEQMDFSEKLSQKLRQEFGRIRQGMGSQRSLLDAAQMELRGLLLDVELLKRALVSLGQIGVLNRRRIEKELVQEILPPDCSRPGAGVMVYRPGPKQSAQVVDCGERLAVCKAACCRIFSVSLTAQEVRAGNYEWEPRKPYSLAKNREGCIYLRSGACSCTIYDTRPVACLHWSCAGDPRIWKDYDKKILNPSLEERLKGLVVDTSPDQDGVEKTSVQSVAAPGADVHNDVAAPVTVTESTPIHQDTGERSLMQDDDGEVSPPDFSELREMFLPDPPNKFVPTSPLGNVTYVPDGPSDSANEESLPS